MFGLPVALDCCRDAPTPIEISSFSRRYGDIMRSIRLAWAIWMLSGFAAAAQVTNAAQVGGQGGGPFDDACRSGDVMIGYNVISGKAMNTFAAVCQAQNNGVLVGKNYGLRTWGKADYNGGPFFGADNPRCPAGSAIFAMEIWVNKFNELDSVKATCLPLRPNTVGVSFLNRSAPSGGQAVRSGESNCPPGTLAVGVTGRSGALVDAVGLACSPFPWHQEPKTTTPISSTQSTSKFVKVIRDADVYDRPAPPSGDKPKGTLARGTASVTLVKKGAPAFPNWYQLSWPGNPLGLDWVYSGQAAPDFVSLDPASLGP